MEYFKKREPKLFELFAAIILPVVLMQNCTARPAETSLDETNGSVRDPYSVLYKDLRALKPVDIHAHIGTFRGFDIGEASLLKVTAQAGIRMTLVSNIDGAHLPGVTGNLPAEKANRTTLEFIKGNPERFKGLLWVQPKSDAVSRLRSWLQTRLPSGERAFVGLKFHPEMNQFSADDKVLDQYMQLCEEFEVPALFHCGDQSSVSSPERIYTLAKRHAKVPVILYHMGFGTDGSAAIAVVEESVRQNDANLYLEISQISAASVVAAVKAVGSERVLFGSDACYFGNAHYTFYEMQLRDLMKSLSPVAINNIYVNNAERLFSLKNLTKAEENIALPG